MGDTDPPPTLEEMADEDENYWMENTTISVSRHTKAQLDHYRDGQPWDQYLEKLRREHADPLTISGVDEIAERLEDAIDVGAIDSNEIAQKVVADLEARLPRKVAEELEGR